MRDELQQDIGETRRTRRTLVVRFRGPTESAVYDRLQDYATEISRQSGAKVHMTDLVRTWIGEKVGVGVG